ncbi:MAG TPA: YeaH/YhbH family protein [Acidocella sp.]|nr:YeaH/YhbH family protein [Acidocella sp.]
MNIVDRRLNPQGKSLSNRRRFIRRAKQELTEAVRKATAERSLGDLGGEDRIWVRADRLREPQIRHSSEQGDHDYVLPGNKQYEEGDRIKRPQSQGGGGGEASEDGDGEDGFQFALSQEEFLDIFFDDLELPDLLRKEMKSADSFTPRRTGYATSGSIPNLNLKRTMQKSLARRIALKRPRPSDICEIEAALATLAPEEETRRGDLLALLEHQQRRSRRIPFIDPVDVRYNRFEHVPQPVTSAVMFCLMDVSGSMTAHMKDLAKRFYKLLYLFLTRRYKNVELVFIRHTHLAREVDEETFFMSTETGGTIVSTAFDEMLRVIADRYPRNMWNIYAAQASDGDNIPGDNIKVAALLRERILPICQYFAYIEVQSEGGIMHVTDLWRTYDALIKSGEPIVARRVSHRGQIFPVFRHLFAPRRLPQASRT